MGKVEDREDKEKKKADDQEGKIEPRTQWLLQSGGNGNSLQHSCLGTAINRGAWQAAVHGFSQELDTTWRLNKKQHNDYSKVKLK